MTDQTYGIRNTFFELYSIAGKTNIISLILAIFILFFCGYRELDLLFAPNEIPEVFTKYKDISPALWALVYCLLLYAFSVPLIRIRKLPYGRLISNIAWLTLAVLLVFIISISISRIQLLSEGRDYLQGIIAIVAVFVAITGWFVNHQIASFNNRVNHTLNMLLQTRISPVFQEHNNNSNKVYPPKSKTIIPDEDIQSWLSYNPLIEDDVPAENKCPNNCGMTQTKIEKISKAISSQCYLLNYYEFLAAGIESGLLDEELLFQTIGGIVLSHIDKSKSLISHFTKDSPKSYENLIMLEKRWRPRRQFELNKMTNSLRK